METIGGILVLGSFVWLIVAIAIIVKRKPLRKRFGILLVPVWFGLLLFGGALLPPTEKEHEAKKIPNPTPSAKEVYRACMNHYFGDPELGYTPSKAIDGLMKIWKIGNPGKQISLYNPRAKHLDGGRWTVAVTVVPEGEGLLDFVFIYSPAFDKIELVSESARDLFGPILQSTW